MAPLTVKKQNKTGRVTGLEKKMVMRSILEIPDNYEGRHPGGNAQETTVPT